MITRKMPLNKAPRISARLHGFVLIDPAGAQLWQGEYPSMWLDPDNLLREATSRL